MDVLRKRNGAFRKETARASFDGFSPHGVLAGAFCGAGASGGKGVWYDGGFLRAAGRRPSVVSPCPIGPHGASGHLHIPNNSVTFALRIRGMRFFANATAGRRVVRRKRYLPGLVANGVP